MQKRDGMKFRSQTSDLWTDAANSGESSQRIERDSEEKSLQKENVREKVEKS